MSDIERHMAKADGAICAAVSHNLNKYRDGLVEHGFTDAEVSELVARYEQQLAVWRQEKLVELRAWIENIIYRGGASLH
jgi:hypothetical protein